MIRSYVLPVDSWITGFCRSHCGFVWFTVCSPRAVAPAHGSAAQFCTVCGSVTFGFTPRSYAFVMHALVWFDFSCVHAARVDFVPVTHVPHAHGYVYVTTTRSCDFRTFYTRVTLRCAFDSLPFDFALPFCRVR